MATVKLATLLIRTAAKPISARIKNQAKEHETFRNFCVSLAQRMYRTEVKLRTSILGEPAKHIRPLSEARAIENGANSLAEGFLFSVAALLILGEAYRSSRSESKRRENVDDQLDELGTQVTELTARVREMSEGLEERVGEERRRNDELRRVLDRVVEIGLRGGWAEFQDTPLQLPIIRTPPPHPSAPSSPSSTPSLPTPSASGDTNATPATSEPIDRKGKDP